jgi:hypothetical protein
LCTVVIAHLRIVSHSRGLVSFQSVKQRLIATNATIIVWLLNVRRLHYKPVFASLAFQPLGKENSEFRRRNAVLSAGPAMLKVSALASLSLFFCGLSYRESVPPALNTMTPAIAGDFTASALVMWRTLAMNSARAGIFHRFLFSL